MKSFSLSAIISVSTTALVSIFGGWDAALQALIAFMIMDYITGVAAAIKHKRLNSEIMYWGGFRKFGILIVVAFATYFDTFAAPEAPIFRTLTITFYIAREGISILENLGKIGVVLPPFIRKVLEQLKEQSEGDNPKRGGKNDK